MVTPPRRRAARRIAWAAILGSLALAMASHGTTPPDRAPALEQAATRCAAVLHREGVTPAPGGCLPRP